MSEMCNSSITPHDSKIHILDIFFFFLSFILSQPLYFSYFIFFSPYLLKLLSFLSPLFFTTLLSILTLFLHDHYYISTSKHNPGFLLSTFLKVSEKFDPKVAEKDDQEMPNFEEFEVYKIVFDYTSTFDHHVIKEIPTKVSDSYCVAKVCTHEHEVSGVTVEERKLNFIYLLEKFENMEKEKKVVDHDEPPCLTSKKVDGELQKEDLVTGSEVNVGNNTGNGGEYTSKVTSNAHPKKNGGNNNREKYTLNFDNSRSSGSSYGSMRKENEWKRTLACKLFEERHSAGGEDGMDSLWETYEKDLKKDSKNTNVKNVKKKNRKNSEISEFYYDFDKEEDDEDDEEEMISGKICCLQALKMSSGKMNFGMGKTNFVKISRALKGIGWLHKVSRQGKKDRY